MDVHQELEHQKLLEEETGLAWFRVAEPAASTAWLITTFKTQGGIRCRAGIIDEPGGLGYFIERENEGIVEADELLDIKNFVTCICMLLGKETSWKRSSSESPSSQPPSPEEPSSLSSVSDGTTTFDHRMARLVDRSAE